MLENEVEDVMMKQAQPQKNCDYMSLGRPSQQRGLELSVFMWKVLAVSSHQFSQTAF